MKPASRLFYLSVFALWATPGSCASQDDCPISTKSIVEDACASYATLEVLNARIKPALDDLTRNTDFFSHYRLNLYNKQCPFWNDEEGMCANIGCAVETLDNEEDIPEIWRSHELSKLEGPRVKHPGRKAQQQNPERPLQGKLGEAVGESCVFEYDDECDERDYCVPEDESAGSKGDYVSLLRNPERFTGYGGLGAKQVWDAIYRENCFQRSSFPHSADLGSSYLPGAAENDFKQILDAAARQQQILEPLSDPSTNLEADGECLEKRVFYRVVSGMHASISTHLCWNFLNQSTGEWQPNPACYKARLHDYPDRISNMYFNYALLTRAVAKLGPYLNGQEYTFCNDDPSEDQATRAKALDVSRRAASVPQIFDESLMFVNGEGPSLKEDFRNRFRNISRVMDCVGCDKCRLWGKIQTAGYGTALKVLFEFDNNSDDIPVLKRTELVALFNTHARLSESIMAVGQFRHMLAGDSDDKPVIVDDSDDFDDVAESAGLPIVDDMTDDMKEFIRLRRQTRKGQGGSISSRFMAEFTLIGQAVKVVINSWLRLPKTLWEIFWSEALRLWQFWLGLPVNPRRWKIQLPDLNRQDL